MARASSGLGAGTPTLTCGHPKILISAVAAAPYVLRDVFGLAVMMVESMTFHRKAAIFTVHKTNLTHAEKSSKTYW